MFSLSQINMVGKLPLVLCVRYINEIVLSIFENLEQCTASKNFEKQFLWL
jgi:hypothetical protein